VSRLRRVRERVSWSGLAPQLASALLVCVLLLAFSLRTVGLGSHELTFDEVVSFSIAVRGPLGVLRYVSGASREHPPLYYLLLSPWMSLTGTTEFAIRFLSVIIGVISVAAVYRLLRRAGGLLFALVAASLLAISPFHIRISRDARMYGLLALCSFLSIFAFLALLGRHRLRWGDSLSRSIGSVFGRIDWIPVAAGGEFVRWTIFWVVTGLGVFTNYFMLFVLLAQDLFVLLNWRRYRHLLLRWLAVHLGLAALVAVWALFSPGLWETLLSLWARGLVSRVRWSAFASALNGLYLGTDLRPNWYHLGLPLAVTALGFAPLFAQRLRLSRNCTRWRLLLGLLLAVPMLAIFALPERVASRYLTTALPPALLTMAAGLVGSFYFVRDRLCRSASTSLGTVLSYLPSSGLLALLLFVSIRAYSPIYSQFGESFVAKTEYLNAHARSDDGLLLHGPWQQLLLSYYDVGSLEAYTIPLRDLSVDPDTVGEYLGRILETHERVWVSYDSVEPVDPDWLVARWLHEHAHQVLSLNGLRLYVRPPAGEVPPLSSADPSDVDAIETSDPSSQALLPVIGRGSSGDYDRHERVGAVFDAGLRLEDVALSNLSLSSGEAILVFSRWQVLDTIPSALEMRLELVSVNGRVWQDYQFRTGPPYVPPQAWESGDAIIERRGLVIPVGTPAGDYHLRLRVFSSGNEWLPQDGRALEIGSVRVLHSTPPLAAVQALPGRDLRAEFGRTLALIGSAPWGRSFTQGNPLLFDVYWQALDGPEEDYELEFELVSLGVQAGVAETVLVRTRVPPIADWSPTSSWEQGDVLKGHYALPIPMDAAPGHYQLRLSVIGSDGSALPVDGMRTSQTLGWWVQEQALSGTVFCSSRSRSRRDRAGIAHQRWIIE